MAKATVGKSSNHLQTSEILTDILDRSSIEQTPFYVTSGHSEYFCRPTCPDQLSPNSHVRRLDSAWTAIAAGLQPCPRCRPVASSRWRPSWLKSILNRISDEPARKWNPCDFDEYGLTAPQLQNWFRSHFGIGFLEFLNIQKLCETMARFSSEQTEGQAVTTDGFKAQNTFRNALQEWLGVSFQPTIRSTGEIPISRVNSPLGSMVIAADEQYLYLLEFADRSDLASQCRKLTSTAKKRLVPGKSRIMEEVQRQLNSWFEGKLIKFSLPLFLAGTKFQLAVWNQLIQIDYHQTVSYDCIARAIGSPRGQRAVGTAVGANRMAIVLPCHRVIRQNGSLSGYAGGIRRKDWLLCHEFVSSTPSSAALKTPAAPKASADP
ncbi:MAG: methylated-DNA--[protein]-cysteine S-methyltransferase [Pirellulaceae bacterium]|nr:methylated-DNA--[protein]-cysteine S-methyltransferase [Pirellulaceae bacterium]